MIRTAESVTKYHPDKICDQISDAILDECLKQDPMSRVAIETMGGHGLICLTGELTTRAELAPYDIAKKVYKELTGKTISIKSNIVKQCPEISKGVNKGGAGDQGIMIGYACRETETHLPKEFHLAREMLRPFHTDGKSQVTLDNGVPTEIVLSIQGKKRGELKDYIADFLLKNDLTFGQRTKVYCNNTGSFKIGGFDADTGVTGRKIVVDAYGPRVQVGGGAFSGKDPTKVDRSGAYMARYIALKEMKESGSSEVLVQLAYVIGKVEPIMATITHDEMTENISLKKYDCRPQAIIERFNLRRPIYLETARNGHFGFSHYPWEIV